MWPCSAYRFDISVHWAGALMYNEAHKQDLAMEREELGIFHEHLKQCGCFTRKIHSGEHGGMQ